MKKIVLGMMLCFSMTSIVSCKCFKKDKNNVIEKNASDPSYDLNNTKWKLVRFDLENRDFKPTEEVAIIELIFNDNTISTTDGCNGQGGAYTQNGSSLEMGNFRATMRYCDETFMKKNGYQIPVVSAKTFSVNENELKLYNKDGKTIATYVKI